MTIKAKTTTKFSPKFWHVLRNDGKLIHKSKSIAEDEIKRRYPGCTLLDNNGKKPTVKKDK